MSALPAIASVVFALLAAVLLVVAFRARAGTLPKGSVRGRRHREVTASERVWQAAQHGAWPILAADAGVAVFHALGCLVAGLGMGAAGASFTFALVVSGLVVVMALGLVASAAGVGAVRSLPPDA